MFRCYNYIYITVKPIFNQETVCVGYPKQRKLTQYKQHEMYMPNVNSRVSNMDYNPLARIGACVGHYRLALGIIDSHWALLARIGHYWLALGIIGSHWALLNCVGHYWLALDIIGSHWAL